MLAVAVLACMVAAPAGAASPPGSASRAGEGGIQQVKLSVNASSASQGSGGDSSVNENLIGVNQIHAATERRLRAIGVRWARIDVSFQGSWKGKLVYNCATGSWNPALLDHTVQVAHRIGATPELLIDYTPPCLASKVPPGTNPNYSPPDVGVDKAKWDHLVAAMARHEIADEGVRVFEVWNEPDWLFWTGGLGAYLQLYVNTARTLEEVAKSLHVSIEVGGPAVADVSVSPDLTWIDALAATAVRDHVPLDFVSWHLYANDPDSGPPYDLCLIEGPRSPGVPCWYNPDLSTGSYARVTREIRVALSAYPSLHPKLWIDEWNINAEGDPRQMGPFGAAFVDSALMNAQAARLSRMSYYNVIDATNVSLVYQDTGMLLPDGDPTPAYEAFLFWHEMAGAMLDSRFSLGSGVSPASEIDPRAKGPVEVRDGPYERMAAVASTGPHGTVRVLVDNFVRYDPGGGYGKIDPNHHERDVTVTITGLGSGQYRTERSMIDAASLGQVVAHSLAGGPDATVRFALPGEGVSLLVFRPVNATIRWHPATLVAWIMGAVMLAALLGLALSSAWKARRLH